MYSASQRSLNVTREYALIVRWTTRECEFRFASMMAHNKLRNSVKNAVCIVHAVGIFACLLACLLSEIGVKVGRALLTSIQYWMFQSSSASALPNPQLAMSLYYFMPCILYTHMVCCSRSQAFLPSTFWSLTVCKNGGGRPHHLSDIGVYLCIQGPTILRFRRACPRTEVPNICKAENVPLIVQDEEHMHKCILSVRDPSPFLSI